jgi:hypothetical protein
LNDAAVNGQPVPVGLYVIAKPGMVFVPVRFTVDFRRQYIVISLWEKKLVSPNNLICFNSIAFNYLTLLFSFDISLLVVYLDSKIPQLQLQKYRLVVSNVHNTLLVYCKPDVTRTRHQLSPHVI